MRRAASAAVASYGSVEEVPLDHVRRVLEVDVVGTLNGVRAALPTMRRQGRGVVVNLASVAGVAPIAYSGAYSMSKAAVLALGGTLRGELTVEGRDGVDVVSVVPTTVDTPFFDNAANVTGKAVHAMPPVNSPDRVASAVVKAIRKPRAEVLVGGGARALVVTARTRPERAERLMARQVQALHLRGEAPPTDGILWTPTPPERASARGGAGGRTRTALRRVVGLGALAGTVVLVRRLRDGR